MGARAVVATAHGAEPELWFRDVPAQHIECGIVTATVRLGKRTSGEPKGYSLGDAVLVRCMAWDDTERARLRVRVRELNVMLLGSVCPEDLIGCPASERTVRVLRQHLVRAYGRDVRPTDVVTIVRFAYLGPASEGV